MVKAKSRKLKIYSHLIYAQIILDEYLSAIHQLLCLVLFIATFIDSLFLGH